MVQGVPKLDLVWRSRFAFMGVPENFFMPRSWVDIDGFQDSSPHMSKADNISLKVLTNAALAEVEFSYLMSESSLTQVGLIPPNQNPPSEEFYKGSSITISEDNDCMGMLGSMLDIANQ